MSLNEAVVEEAALNWFKQLGYATAQAPHLAPGEIAAERKSFTDVILFGRLRDAITRLNPAIPSDAREEGLRKILRHDAPSLVSNNRAFHRMLRDGVPVEYRRDDGSIAGDHVRLIDFDNPDANDWLAVNQFTVIEGQNNRRPDIVVFINGMPLGIIELKIPEDTDKWFAAAYNQIQTYKREIPSLMHYNELTVISDGLEARIGSLAANQEWFKVWRTIEGEFDAPATALELETLVRGVFEKRRFLDLIRNFIAFEDDPDSGAAQKLIAGYHQFHAVKAAVDETIRATAKDRAAEVPGTYWAGKMEGGKEGDRRVGVVWHTQGSGKSLSMLFYAGCIIEHPAMENPTLVFLTDRNDLDDQLFGQFQRCHEIVRQTPVQAESVEHLRKLLNVASGGVVFTTMQKFMPDEPAGRAPLLSNRRNILVIADEAHRSQYDLIDGLARNVRDSLPNASFIGFTGTPIEITEGEELTRKEKLKTKWAALEALVGNPKRIDLIAADFVKHYERRLEAMEGKAMIVCMSRRICIELYNAIIKLRPEWASGPNDDDNGNLCVMKIVMTGSAEDGPDWQQHIRNKEKRRKLASRFKDSKDPFKIVIVRDMWLTGFDAPSLSTMYVDKPMRGHGLMQAIARVNRVFRDKPGGLVVDYLGLADQLKYALAMYTQSGGKGSPSIDTAKAIAVMLEKHEIACGMMHGFDWSKWHTGTPAEKVSLLPGAQEHILKQKDGKDRFVQIVTELSQAFALCAGTDEAIKIRDDIGFFQQVKIALARPRGLRKTTDELDHAVRQLVAKAIAPEGEIIDVFQAAGLKQPDISILSDQFLAEVRGLKHKNVAAELLAKLLGDEIKVRSKRNVVQSREFSETLISAASISA